jgi:predicted CoA-binding protein
MAAFANPDAAAIRDLLERARTIAVVGASPNAARPSHGVSAALQRFGYRIIPIHPIAERILGEPVLPDLADLAEPVDIVDVFRAPEHVDRIVDICIEKKLPALWLQEGVVNREAAQRARDAGIFVVMDRCIYKDRTRLVA